MIKTRNIDNWQPGDLTPGESLAQMIRVNHAGEYGAKRIYQGQLAVLGKKACGDTIRHMAGQEEKHLEVFSRMIAERRVRPTTLLPLWHMLGYALGAGTAFLGEKAAMACTVAVEEVIDEHYAGQESSLDDKEKELKRTIAQFRKEEQEHRDIGLAHDAKLAPAYPLLTAFIKSASRTAIWLSKKI